jgi:hypothetical protein
MDSTEFKNMFGDAAKAYGFAKASGGWFKESTECLGILELQKSNFGNYYQLNIKIFIQGAFGNNRYMPNKALIVSSMGHITKQVRGNELFDFDASIADAMRKNLIDKLFKDLIVPFVDVALSRSGVRLLAEKGAIVLPPAVKKEVGLM